MTTSVARAALVTGGSRGIGNAIALALAEAGWRLTLAARDETTLAAAAERALAAGSPGVTTVVADLADPAAVDTLAAAHAGVRNDLSLLVHAAGVGTAGDLADYPARRLDKQWTVNARAPFLLTQALLPALRRAAAADPERGARVVGLASLEGVCAEPGLAAYGMTKAAMISFCESVSVSEHGHGVAATAISPGYVDTEMSAWQHDRIAPGTMIRARDIAELVLALTRLSRWAVVPNLVISRAGDALWRA